MSTVAEIANDLNILVRYFGAGLLEANHDVLFVGDNASQHGATGTYRRSRAARTRLVH